jgi:hypothetical protein
MQSENSFPTMRLSLVPSMTTQKTCVVCMHITAEFEHRQYIMTEHDPSSFNPSQGNEAPYETLTLKFSVTKHSQSMCNSNFMINTKNIEIKK